MSSLRFQSTPVIANGRIDWSLSGLAPDAWFQSTPVIANGRIDLSKGQRSPDLWFQSTPVIANGRISGQRIYPDAIPEVSIHARYC